MRNGRDNDRVRRNKHGRASQKRDDPAERGRKAPVRRQRSSLTWIGKWPQCAGPRTNARSCSLSESARLGQAPFLCAARKAYTRMVPYARRRYGG